MSSPSLTRAIGVISGTSMDGIDVALVETDGDRAVRPGPGATYPYPDALRAQLLRLIAEAERAQTDPLSAIEDEVTQAHMGAVRSFMAAQGLDARDVGLVGLHGQTVFHRPEARFTRQLGFGERIAPGV